MLTHEALVASIEDLVHHFVHVGDRVHLSIDGHVLETEEAVVDQLQVSIVLNVMHRLIARFENGCKALTNDLPVTFCDVGFDMLLRKSEILDDVRV